MLFRRFILVLAFAVLGLAAPAGSASASECRALEHGGRFEVAVNIDVNEPDIYNNLSKAELGGSNAHGRRGQTLGTMQSGVSLSWSINYQFREAGDVVCFAVASADVDLAYDQLDIYIAADYQPQSCQYEAVLDHEQEHVVVAQTTMRAYEQRFRDALDSRSIPTPDRPAEARSQAEAQAEVDQLFKQKLLPLLEEMTQELEVRQAQVDTLENYQKTWRRCRRW